MNTSLKSHLIKNIASAFINGLITLILLLIAPLGLAGVIFNTLAITVSTFIVTMGFDFITIWLLNPSRQQYFDREMTQDNRSFNDEYINPIIRQNNTNFPKKRNEE